MNPKTEKTLINLAIKAIPFLLKVLPKETVAKLQKKLIQELIRRAGK